MKNKKPIFIILALALTCVLLTACSGSGGADDGDAKYSELKANENGAVTIPVETISSDARFFNYDADGVTVQLVAIRDQSNGVHIAFNTCQSCSPSPKAYYQQTGSVLQCANCGFTFAPEEVGVTHGGCNPWPIDGLVTGDRELSVPAAALDGMRQYFVSWKGPTE